MQSRLVNAYGTCPNTERPFFWPSRFGIVQKRADMHKFRRVTAFVFFALCFAVNSAWARDLEKCNSIVNNDLIECAHEGYVEKDKELNKLYSKFIAGLEENEKSEVKSVQLQWIRFKEKYCKDVYDNIYPGREASIDYNLCLDSVTDDRIAEITRMMERDGCDECTDFVKTLSAISETGYKKSVLYSKINTHVASLSDKNWNNYVRANCAFSSVYVKDKREVCEARLNFNYLKHYKHVSGKD
jgi:uncharacterized protein YecT (DUF1311 family)